MYNIVPCYPYKAYELKNIRMKKRHTIPLIALIILCTWSYFQLFQNPKQVPGDYLNIDKIFSGHTDEVWSAKFSPNDSLVVSTGYDENTIIWKRNDGNIVHYLKHPYGCSIAIFNPDGTKVATGSYDGKIRIWDVQTGSLQQVFNGHNGALRSISYHSKQDLIAAGGDDNKVTIWNSKTGEIVREFNDSSHDVWSVIFSPSGEYLLSGSSDNIIRVYEVSTGEIKKSLEGHSMVVLSLDFSPDGKLLASGSDDKTVKIWDTKNWQLLHSLNGDNEAIHSVVFVDNNKVFAGGTDKKLLGEFLEYHFGYQGNKKYTIATLWDIKNEKILQTVSEHNNDLNTLCDVSSDGRWLVTPSSDKTVRLWKINTPHNIN